MNPRRFGECFLRKTGGLSPSSDGSTESNFVGQVHGRRLSPCIRWIDRLRVAETRVAPSFEAYRRIAGAAKELNELRERWLNPLEWVEPIAKAVDAADDFADVPEEARELIRHSAIMARAAKDPKLKKRTLTNLYNERPTWLKLAHEQLDRATLAAYAASDPDGQWSEDWSQVWIDTGAGQPLQGGLDLTELRKETDQRVLANLLRMNLERAERK